LGGETSVSLPNSFFTLVRQSSLSDLFSDLGASAKIRILFLGLASSQTENLMNQTRSLNIEHVSPAGLMRQEISRRTALGIAAEKAARHGKTVDDETTIALMRRWFWARKPDAGFALTGFPATLLQAKVFDEWLEARDEALHCAIVGAEVSARSVVEHYRMHGLAIEADIIAA
jgi:adenylate kinase